MADVRAVAALVLLTGVFYLPALVAGPSFGPFDVMSSWPLMHGLYPTIKNAINQDQIRQMNPWLYYDWTTVHSGQFPLWDRYVMLGMPHFADFQSAVLSLPTLVSYLFPVNQAYLVVVVFTSLLAGGGAYLFARCLGVSSLPAVFAAVAFEFSGTVLGWTGWPLATTNAYTGWMLTFGYLILTGARHRLRNSICLGATIAFTVYAGHPESYVTIGFTCVLILGLVAILEVRRHRLSLSQVRVALLWLLQAAVLGILLSAPLLLPGLQSIANGNGKILSGYYGIPIEYLWGLLTQGYHGYPFTTSVSIGPVNYYESACYVGPLVIALALLAMWSRPVSSATYALGAAGLAWLAIVFEFGPVQWLINAVPHLNTISLSRGLIQLDFCLCLLGGIGLDTLLYARRPRVSALTILVVASAMSALLLVAFWQTSVDAQLSDSQQAVRYASLFWPTLLVAGTYAIALACQLGSKAIMRYVTLAVFAVQAGFLITAGINLPSYSSAYFPMNQDMMQVRQIVGSGLLGTYSTNPPNLPNGLGFLPETNIAYGVREFAAYDATLPDLYYQSWAETTDNSRLYTVPAGGFFSPGVTSAEVAREYGIQYLIGAPARGIALVSNLTARIASALSGTPYNTSSDEAAVAGVLNTYLLRDDVQKAIPWAGPSSISKVFAWAAQYGIHDTPALLQYSAVLQSLSRALDTNPLLQLAVGSLVVMDVPPSGTLLVKSTPYYQLYAVPGSGQFSIEPSTVESRVISITWVNNYTCKVVLETAQPGLLISRIADVPGWTASVNGRGASIALRDNLLQQISIPAGRDTVVLTYWPRSFTAGLVLAAGGLLWILVLVCYAGLKVTARLDKSRVRGIIENGRNTMRTILGAAGKQVGAQQQDGTSGGT